MSPRRRLTIATAFTALLAAAAPCLAETGSVVFESSINETHAQTRRAELLERFDIHTEVVPAMVDGVRYHRVMTPVMERSDAQALMSNLQADGVAAWYLRREPEPRQVVPEPASEAPVSTSNIRPPVAVKPTSVAQATTAAPATPPVPLRSNLGDESIRIPYYPDVDITVDGRIDEAIWSQVPAYDEMRVMDPDTLEEPSYRTFSRFLYTSEGLYVSAHMEQPPETLISRLSSRDKYLNRDGYGITLDTSGQGLYGYWFVVNLGGSLMDGKVVPERTMTEQWDGPWRGASARLADGWSVELFLPWSMMALPAGSTDRSMGIWIDRKVAHMDERYGWPALPFTGSQFMSALQPVQFGELEPKRQFAVFPFVSTTFDEITGEQESKVGADFAWRPSTNTQITATLNPDFGAVESDDVVVNLTAFETFFPEKRLFFLEGSEVFVTTRRSDPNRFVTRRGSGARTTPATFTSEPTTLVNTRRIGGPPRNLEIPDGIDIAPVELGKPTDLLGAVKVTGSQGPLRYGLLAAAEDEVELPAIDRATGTPTEFTADGRNFGVIRGLYESSATGRRSIGYLGTVVDYPDSRAMTHGIDTHLLSASGRVEWDTQFMYSDVDDTEGYGMFSDMTYTQRRGLVHTFGFDYIDDKLDINDLGFIRQNDTIVGRYGLVRTKGQGLKRLRNMRNSIFFYGQTNTDGFLTRAGIYSNQSWTFLNNSQFRWTVNYFPERWDDVNSRGNGMFKTDDRWFMQFAFGTDSAKKFSWSGTLGAEQEELDGTWTYGTDFGFTWTPNDRFSVDLDLQFKNRDGWLLHRGGRDFTTYAADDFQPRLAVDLFITANQQLRLTTQWAGIKAEAQDYWQVPVSEGDLVPRAPPPPGAWNEDFSLSRLTAQARYRWQIGPLSDLFLVYTRGSNLTNLSLDEGFDDLWQNALDEPVIDVFVIKLRYRFGT